MEPSYLKLHRSGELHRRAEILREKLSACDLCPRQCGVNRLQGEKGFCQAGENLKIAKVDLHFGEEPPISGTKGSGAIFFSGCSLRCVFCQNYPISQRGQGREMSIEELAAAMLDLQARGAHNINLVSPTHFIPQIAAALELAAGRGLHLPLVYNSNGYESVATLKLLDGIIDVYLPDGKYGDDESAIKYSGVKNYVKYNRLALQEMHRQVGNPVFDAAGMIQKGLIVRHLVLPNGLAGSRKVFDFLAREISPETWVSLMAQYTPIFKASSCPELNRPLTAAEYQRALGEFSAAGLANGWTQALEASGTAQIPDFSEA